MNLVVGLSLFLMSMPLDSGTCRLRSVLKGERLTVARLSDSFGLKAGGAKIS